MSPGLLIVLLVVCLVGLAGILSADYVAAGSALLLIGLALALRAFVWGLAARSRQGDRD